MQETSVCIVVDVLCRSNPRCIWSVYRGVAKGAQGAHTGDMDENCINGKAAKQSYSSHTNVMESRPETGFQLKIRKNLKFTLHAIFG